MAEYLVIRLSATDAQQADWVVVDSVALRSSAPESGPLERAAPHAQQRPVVVLVPGETVLLTATDLPVRGAARMLQAVPYALEENLADDVGDLHFALGRRRGDGQVPVAVVRDELISGWNARLAAAGLTADTLLPDTACLPAHAGFTILIDHARVLLRAGDGATLVGETDTVAALVQALGATPEAEQAESHYYLSDVDAATYSRPLAELRMLLPELQQHELRNGALPLLALGAVQAQSAPNLLQGSYAVTGDSERYWQPWRGAAMLAGVLVLAALGVKAAELMTLNAQLGALNAQINAVAAEALPPGSRIVEPVTQLEQHARALRGTQASGDFAFLQMLEALGAALSGAGTTIDKLDFRNGTLDITLDAPNVDTLDRIRRGIEGAGALEAEIQSANQRNERVQGRLRVRGGNS